MTVLDRHGLSRRGLLAAALAMPAAFALPRGAAAQDLSARAEVEKWTKAIKAADIKLQ